jgi:hypothetical protein
MKCFDLEKSDPKTKLVQTMLGLMPCLPHIALLYIVVPGSGLHLIIVPFVWASRQSELNQNSTQLTAGLTSSSGLHANKGEGRSTKEYKDVQR